MVSNQAVILQSFHMLRSVLAPYIAVKLSSAFGNKVWWRDGVMKILREEQKRRLPQKGDFETLTDALDIYACLLLLDLHWNHVFKQELSTDHRTWAKELTGVRNKLAHMGGPDFSDDDTRRALDTMSRLAGSIDAEIAGELREISRDLRRAGQVIMPNSEMLAGPKRTRFLMTAVLEGTGAGNDARRIAEEVIYPFAAVAGGVEVSIEIHVNTSAGMSDNLVRAISESFRTLPVKAFEFRE